MSDAANASRASRQRLAAPGGRQDRIVRIARVALPMAAGVLVALLAMAPLTNGRDVSFLLDKTKVDVAPERMRAQAAEYRGRDDKGQPFSLTARSAVQRSTADQVVRMNGLAARIGLADGPAALTAEQGRYDLTGERVAIDGPVLFSAPDGYKLATSDVTVDMRTRKMESAGPVQGRMPLGAFSADKLSADLGERRVVLEGRVRLKIVQGGLK